MIWSGLHQRVTDEAINPPCGVDAPG